MTQPSKGRNSLLSEDIISVISRIATPDQRVGELTKERLDQLTKPVESLGRLEDLAVTIATIRGVERPKLTHKAVFVLAGDHGVVEEGVSAFPQAVTAQMVLNFLNGGAAINVLARQAGAKIVVADLGVASSLPEHSDLWACKVRAGTRNMAHEPAMTSAETIAAIRAGIRLVDYQVKLGLDLVATGEMGIGNTTAASALTAAFTGASATEVTGRGTGISDEALLHKQAVVQQILDLHRPQTDDGFELLSRMGGLEIAGLVGVMLGAAANRLPILLDGFISTAAALPAVAICPMICDYLIASHQSVENGHSIALNYLGLTPLFDLDLRLGEGSGAALAMPILDAACAILDQMATFAEAGVAGKSE